MLYAYDRDGAACKLYVYFININHITPSLHNNLKNFKYCDYFKQGC